MSFFLLMGGASKGSTVVAAPTYDFSLVGPALPSGVALTRSSVATYFNASSQLVVAGVNQPRFDNTTVSTASPPVTVNDAYVTSQNTALTVSAPGVLSNDTDQGGLPITVNSADTASAHGAIACNLDGSFTYTPVSGYNGADVWTYNIKNSQGLISAARANVNMTVNPIISNQVTINWTAPATGASISGNVTFSFSGTNIVSVELFGPSGRLTSTSGSTAATVGGSGTTASFIYNSAQDANGSRSYFAIATGAAGTANSGTRAFSLSNGAPRANILIDCSSFNTPNWATFNTPAPTISGTLVADPNGAITAQQITFPTSRTGFQQVFNPTPNAGTFTTSFWAKGAIANQQLQLAYYHGDFPTTQQTAVILLTTSWQRYGPFTFTITAGDSTPSLLVENISGDNTLTIPAAETINIWGVKVEAGSSISAFTGCAQPQLPLGPKILGAWVQPTGSPNPTLAQIASAAPKYNAFVGVTLGITPGGATNGALTVSGVLPSGDTPTTVATWKNTGKLALVQLVDSAVSAGANAFLLTSTANELSIFNLLVNYITTTTSSAFNGVMFDFESGGTVFTAANVIGLAQRLKQQYGQSFVVALSLRISDFISSGLVTALNDVSCDWGVFQEYNSAVYADTTFAQIKADFNNIIVNQGVSPNKVLLGVGPSTLVSNGTPSSTTSANAITFLQNTYANFRGSFVWTVRTDDSQSWAYHNALAAAMGLTTTGGTLPARIMGIYFFIFDLSNPTAGTVAQIQANFPKINLIYGFVAQGGGTTPSFGAPYANFANDIAAWKASGRIAILSIGGQGVAYTMGTVAQQNAFVANLIPIIDQFGFTGMDWDLESSDIPAVSAIVNISNSLKAHYGQSFVIHCAPQPGGNQKFRGPGTPYFDAAIQLGNNFDLGFSQFYGQGNLNSDYAFEIDDDFTINTQGGIPASKLGIGMGNYDPANEPSYAQYLASYDAAVAKFGIRGIFIYAQNGDVTGLYNVMKVRF